MKFKFLDEDIALEITRVFAELSDEELKETLDEINYLGQTSRTIRKINVLDIKPKLRLIKNEEETK
jgi:DNA-directed RNA polymerase subunit F